jgi:hypothetical protein
MDWPEKYEHIPRTIKIFDESEWLVATLNNQAIAVQLVYTDEGFLLAKRLKQFAVVPGASLGLV